MKKVQRNISLRGGLFRGNTSSVEKDHADTNILVSNNQIVNGQKVEINGEGERKDANMTMDEKQVSRKKKVLQRSKTVTYHSSVHSAPAQARASPAVSVFCTICNTDYTKPKQLPCLHTFCQNCIEKFVNPKLLVQCPTCRKVSLMAYEVR